MCTCSGPVCGGAENDTTKRFVACDLCSLSYVSYGGLAYTVVFQDRDDQEIEVSFCGHIAARILNNDWPTFDEVDINDVETRYLQMFHDAQRRFDLVCWVKLN